IRYNNSPGDIHEIIREIAVLLLYTDCFEKNSLHLSKEELDNTEPLDQLIERIQQIPNAYTQLNPLVELPFYNNQIDTSDLLFNTSLLTTLYPPPLNNPLLFINQTMATTTDDIMNYLKANTSESLLLKVEPFTGDDELFYNLWINSETTPAFYLMQILEKKIYTIDDSKFNINKELTKEQQEQASQFLTNNIDIFLENILEKRTI
ncbi:4059_t:CDS:2, partial [Scutellospora calospora]